MLRVKLAQFASTSTCAQLSTSAVLQAAMSRRAMERKARQLKKAERVRSALENRPHVVLGNRPGDADKWKSCNLAHVILTEKDITAAPKLSDEAFSPDDRQQPTHTNYGLGPRERELLFDILPPLTAEGKMLARVDPDATYDPVTLVRMDQEATARAAQKAVQFARLVDLRNANAKGIAYENKRRIVAAFSEPENPVDPGRPEVQAAILTMEIRNVWDHLSRCKRDKHSRVGLRKLIHKRAKILRYLKNVDPGRYARCLERIGCEPGSVEGELVV